MKIKLKTKKIKIRKPEPKAHGECSKCGKSGIIMFVQTDWGKDEFTRSMERTPPVQDRFRCLACGQKHAKKFGKKIKKGMKK